jgi:hypothetical protein
MIPPVKGKRVPLIRRGRLAGFTTVEFQLRKPRKKKQDVMKFIGLRRVL